MKQKYMIKGLYILMSVVMAIIISGSMMPAQVVQETDHKDVPGSPVGKVMQTVHDQVDENTASTKQAFGGDDFKNGKYERPFDQDMNYIPQIDLETVKMSREDPLWIYVQFMVIGKFADSPSTTPQFMVELDTDLDNRGNYLVITGMPASTEWSVDTVQVLSNPDFNIGGTEPVKPDETKSEGRGYYEEMFPKGEDSDPDLAWSRISADNPDMVELAFKNTLTGGEKGKFIWLPWSNVGMTDLSMFEFNDHFTYEEAGYPLKEDAVNYPIKEIWGVDNTCRVASNFTPEGYMPGLCPDYSPVIPVTGNKPKICCVNGRCFPCP